MIKNRGLAVKLTLLILSSMTLVLAVVLGSYYFSSIEIIEENVRKNAEFLLQATVNKIDNVLLFYLLLIVKNVILAIFYVVLVVQAVFQMEN